MGDSGDEIWIYAKLPPEEIERTLIYEVLGIYYEDEGVMENEDDNSHLLEEIVQVIWQNKNCQEMVKVELNLK